MDVDEGMALFPEMRAHSEELMDAAYGAPPQVQAGLFYPYDNSVGMHHSISALRPPWDALNLRHTSWADRLHLSVPLELGDSTSPYIDVSHGANAHPEELSYAISSLVTNPSRLRKSTNELLDKASSYHRIRDRVP
jgi:hypothetical protein